MSRFIRALLLAGAAVAVTAADARATLFLRISDGTNTETFMSGGSSVSATPGIVGPGSAFGIIGATLTTSATSTSLTHTLSLDYSFTNPPGTSASKLTVEFYENNQSFSGPGTVTVTTSATTGPLASATAQFTTAGGGAMLTSQLTANTAIPLPAGIQPPLAGTQTSQTGDFNGTSTVPLTPNPATTGSTAAVSPFGFYQVFMGTNYTPPGAPTTGHGSFRGTSTVNFTATPNPVPEPATLVGAFMGLASLGLVKLRRRK